MRLEKKPHDHIEKRSLSGGRIRLKRELKRVNNYEKDPSHNWSWKSHLGRNLPQENGVLKKWKKMPI
jgi:hypothetical protein